MLAVFSGFCLSMELVRIIVSSSPGYIFLIWNLVLAWVPYLLSLKFIELDIRKQWISSSIIMLLWVAFLPNGPYIITDLIHLRPRIGIPMWYDVLLVSTMAWNGLLLTLLSVNLVHRKLEEYFSAFKLWVALIILFLSSGYGIYIGRFMRLNSWDAFLRPLSVLHYLFADLIHPFHHPRSILVTVIVTILLSLSYSIFYLMGHKPASTYETV
jgi:uncharacterized membrane protein